MNSQPACLQILCNGVLSSVNSQSDCKISILTANSAVCLVLTRANWPLALIALSCADSESWLQYAEQPEDGGAIRLWSKDNQVVDFAPGANMHSLVGY